MKHSHVAFALGLAVVSGTGAAAQQVGLTPDRLAAEIELNGRTITIERNQDLAATLTGDYARTSRACPPDCIQPMVAAAGVTTIAELEVIAFVETLVATTGGLLIDARMPGQFATGTVPGAVNVPHAALASGNPYLTEILVALGARSQGGGSLTFSDAMELAVFGDGPWSDDADRAIENLIAAGYPPGKIRYYRGGMQDWLSLGLTVSRPQTEG